MSRASTKDQEAINIFKDAVRNEIFSYDQLRMMLIKVSDIMNTNTIEDVLRSVSIDLIDLTA